MGHLWHALCHVYDVLGFDAATDGDEVFRALVLARVIEPVSRLDSLDPQITMGLLTDAAGFPLMVNAFEGNTAETKTMLPVIEALMAPTSSTTWPWWRTPAGSSRRTSGPSSKPG